jgi:sialate O-acetylesterase
MLPAKYLNRLTENSGDDSVTIKLEKRGFGVKLMHGLLAACTISFGLAIAPTANAKPRLRQIFTDHAVLQRDRAVEIWGTADPLEHIIIAIAGQSVETDADAGGNWRTQLAPMKAGGPFTLSVANKSGETQQLNDIVIGDVFLCSGQSNMEMQVKASMNADAEIKQAHNTNIRMYTVARASAPTPLEELKFAGSWKNATPENVGEFSAACFFFAREVQPQINVPIGLINASWGGSAIEAWIGADGLTAAGHGTEIALLDSYTKDEQRAQRQFGAGWESYWEKNFADAGRPWADKGTAGWTPVPLPMRDWKKWGDADLAQLNGMLWYRHSFTLTPEQAKQGATLHLGAIDEIDMTWVNGKPLAQSFGWGENRDYAVPVNMLRAGHNDIVTNIYSGWDMGGMFGPAEAIRLEMKDGRTVALGDGWTYKKVPKGAGDPPRAPWLAIGGLTNIGNAMIAPLAPYGLRGALWYQGESNAGNAKPYRSLLTALMADWRLKFQNPDMPFMVVQLPNFGQPVIAPARSGWADLREAQRLAVHDDKAAGLTVTIDAGQADELHPPNKQLIGKRLARLARNLVYRENVTASGPVPLRATRADKSIIVSFGSIDGLLVSRSAASAGGFEVCGADQPTCTFVDGHIDGDRVLLAVADPSQVQRIRHCWGDAPLCNLYDTGGLPAGPFEIEVE